MRLTGGDNNSKDIDFFNNSCNVAFLKFKLLCGKTPSRLRYIHFFEGSNATSIRHTISAFHKVSGVVDRTKNIYMNFSHNFVYQNLSDQLILDKII